VFITVFLTGLKLVCEESAEDENSNHLETLLDVQSACKIAVEILNDLLCFDKLESGILELHKHDVAVTPFINDCVNMFVSQAREAGVSISITSEDPSLSPLHQGRGSDVSEGLREDDIVCMDKFKMDQVLRNLISNALKFTPRGGSVTVCASFVEGENSPAPTHSLSNRSTGTGTMKDFVRTWHGRLLGMFGRLSSPSNVVRGSSAGYSGWNALQSQETFGATSSQIEECQRGGSCSNDIGIEDVEGNGHGNGNGSVSNSQYRALSNADWESTVSSQDRILHEHDEYTEFQGNQIVNGKLRIAVTDTGAGISEANQARLFKEVVQFNPEVLQAGGGSGLGLWITNSIVQMHSGSIRVSSKGPGQGTSFVVEIDMQRRTSSLTSRQPSITTTSSATSTATGTGLECRVGVRADDDVNTAHRVPSILVSRSTSMSMSTSRCTSAEQSTDISEGGVGVAIKSEAEVGVEEESLTSMRAKGAYDYTKQLKGTPHPFYVPCSPHAVGDLPFSPQGPVIAPPLSPLSSLTPLAALDSGQRGNVRFRFKDPDPPIERSYDVLVVDDSGLNRKLLCRLLRASKHICDEANDGLAALERVKIKMAGELGANLRYDVILIDFVMPVMDGPTATKAIRALGYEGLILGVTGNTLDSDINYFVKCGADAVLAKPFDFAAFRAHMTAHEQNHSVA
jgi:signal transduction histidine kinase/CheY-like chemotaxis protein